LEVKQMDIGTIIAGLQAIASVAEAMNKAPALTPAQAEEKKPKAQQPMSTVVVLPNQTPPMGVGVPPPPAPMRASDYWSQLPPANVLRNPLWRIPQVPFGVPVFRGVPLITDFPNFGGVSLQDLYEVYFGTRF
jgi:hypothetical protein